MNKKDIEAAQLLYELLADVEKAANQLKALYFSKMQEIERKGIYVKADTGITTAEAKIYAVTNDINFDEQNILSYAKYAQRQDGERMVRVWVQDPTWKKRKAELIDLINSLSVIFMSIYSGELEIFEKTIKKAAKDSYDRKMDELKKMFGSTIPADRLTESDIDTLMANRWRGATYSERIRYNTQQLADNARTSLIAAFISGKSAKESWEMLEREFEKAWNNAHRLIRTEATYMANMVQLRAYKELGIEKYRYVAILDMRTSEMCRAMNGKIFNVESAMPGVNFPPLHPWCRSTTRPVER